MNTKQTDQTYVAHTYARFPVEIVSGRGSEVFDETGKRYIDLTSGIGVDAFGVADPEWIAAVTAQLGKVQHISNLFYTAPAANLAKLLCERTGMKRVFFSNSGAEANECAIKAARKYAAQTHGADTYTILTLEKSFHGRTLATLSATGQEKYHAQFQPLLPGFVHTPANDLAALRAAAGQHKLAAVMMECVQGEGGVTALDPEFAQGAATGAEVTVVVAVRALQDGIAAVRPGEGADTREEGLLAEVASVGSVLGEAGDGEGVEVEDFVADAKRTAVGGGLVDFAVGDGRKTRRHRDCIVAQNIMGDAQEKGRIHPARKGDDS